MHMVWIITGTILLVSLSEMENSFQTNIDQANEFSIMRECAEPEAYIDVQGL